MKSLYIHVPFCTHICSYCDFPKMFYIKKWIHPYLKMLEKEIRENYKGELLNTIYIGGGTPSALSLEELKELLEIVKMLHVTKNIEYTIECNLENLTKEKILLFKEYGVNRLSIGIQTFQKKQEQFLNRKMISTEMIEFAKIQGFSNINIDLIYALPNETIEELKDDLEQLIKLDVPHISTYSLMIEPHTILSEKQTNPIDEDLDATMYQIICDTLKKHGFKHYEVSNFSKEGYESKHNLNYWNNLEYYGFGLGASGYVGNTRYTNTRSITKYLNHEFRLEEEKLSEKDKMSYEMILGLRKLEGVSENTFYSKYQKRIDEVFDIIELIERKKLIKEDHYLKIDEKYIYLSNDILINFVGGYNE